MVEDKVYSSVLDYMCEHYDYILYATDFDSRCISLMKRAIASVPSIAGSNRSVATKFAIEDFFNALYQQVFVYYDEDRLKIVKYFDNGAINEQQDRIIHALRLELIKFKDELSQIINKNQIYMFEDRYRNRFEFMLTSLSRNLIKDILREQISLVFDLDNKDIVIFLNQKIFVKKFQYIEDTEDIVADSILFLEDKRFVTSLWAEINKKLYNSFSYDFEFINFDEKYFFKNYPLKFFSIIKIVVKKLSYDLIEEEILAYTNISFKKYLPLMLGEASSFVLKKVLEGDLKAIKFLKIYFKSTKYKNILAVLKKKELLNSKITHKMIELKKIKDRVAKSLHIQRKSQDEMENIQKRRLELLVAIEKVENEIHKVKDKITLTKVDLNRLEFSKRDLLEAFKQVEVRVKTQINIQKNTDKELEKWEFQKNEKILQKEQLSLDFRQINKEYTTICQELAILLRSNP